jgi:hypothetical protein
MKVGLLGLPVVYTQADNPLLILPITALGLFKLWYHGRRQRLVAMISMAEASGTTHKIRGVLPA